MGRLPSSNSGQPPGSISPPPPAPPARNTSIIISMDGVPADKHHHHLSDLTPIEDTLLASESASGSSPFQSDGTLRGPNKPLPPTPSDLTPDFDESNDGTLMIHRKHSRNGSQSNIRQNNSGSIVDLTNANGGAQNRLSIVGKAASVPDVSWAFKF